MCPNSVSMKSGLAQATFSCEENDARNHFAALGGPGAQSYPTQRLTQHTCVTDSPDVKRWLQRRLTLRERTSVLL